MKRSHKAIEEDLSKGRVDHNNSPTLALSSGESFTGAWTCVEEYASVSVLVIIDTTGGESGTLVMELSPDTTNTRSKSVLISLGNSSVHTLSIVSRYFRISFDADQSTTCTGVIQTLYHHYRTQGLMSFVGETINDQNDAQLVRAVLTGVDELDGDYHNLTVKNGGLSVEAMRTDSFNRGITTNEFIRENIYFPSRATSIQQITIVNSTGFTTEIDNDETAILTANPASAFGSATIATRKYVQYRNGYDTWAIWELKFSNHFGGAIEGAALNGGNMVIGFATSYLTGQFGAWVQHSSVLASYKITVTAAATGPETATLTVNNIPWPVPLTGGNDINFTAHEIAKAVLFDSTSTLYQYAADHSDNVIDFIQIFAQTEDETAPALNFTSATAAATITVNTSGVTGTPIFIPPSSWNQASSDYIASFDPTEWHTYRFRMKGMGDVDYFWEIYDSDISDFRLVHCLCSPADIPFKRGSANFYNSVFCSNLGFGQPHVLELGSLSSGTTAVPNFFGPRFSFSAVKSIPTNTEQVILSIASRNQLNGLSTNLEIRIDRLSVASDGTKSVKIKIIKIFFENGDTLSNGLISDYSNTQFVNDNSFVGVDSSFVGYTGGEVIYEFVLAKVESLQVDYADRALTLGNAEAFIVTAESAGASDVDVAISWLEDY